MLQLSTYPFELAFEYPFVTAKGIKTHQPTLVVSLGLGPLRGYGEAPAIHYYGVTVDQMIGVLESKRQVIERYALIDPHRFWHFLEHLLPGNNFLIAALDMAGWDLFAQMRRAPLGNLLGITGTAPATDYTLGIGTAEEMIMKMKAHPAPVYKIKIAGPDDLDLIAALRRHTDVPFRADANEGLNFEDTIRLLPELQRLGVTLLEQPLPRNESEAMRELKRLSPIPLFADESCVVESDVAGCAENFHGINIKLTKCGGITPAMRMVKQARELGLKLMFGSMNECSIGTAALAHLAPLADELDADGPLLLREDVAEGLSFDKGLLRTLPAPGLGIRFLGKPVAPQ
jgi:L-alanine-DL-glutamate epimerase-like enolase superfamily enzyme